MNDQMLINGQWVDAIGGERWNVVNPATEEVIASVPFGDERDAEAAVEAAAQAQPAWAALTAYERAVILTRVATLIRARLDDLAPIMTRECGKPLGEARGEWGAAADLFEWFAEEGKRAYGRTIPARKGNKRLLVLHEPVGVVATITAWNFPAYLPARKWSGGAGGGEYGCRQTERTHADERDGAGQHHGGGRYPARCDESGQRQTGRDRASVSTKSAGGQDQLHRFAARGATADARGGGSYQEAVVGTGRQRPRVDLR
jgi:hypothetical protein